MTAVGYLVSAFLHSLDIDILRQDSKWIELLSI